MKTRVMRAVSDSRSHAFLRILALLIVVAISIYIFSIREHAQQFAAFGYPGIFLISLLSNATIFLPAPGVAIVFTMGSIFNPLGVALAASMGGALGELTGFLAGYSGRSVVERNPTYQQTLPFVQKYGIWAIFLLAAIPNPLFDLAGIAAGVTRIPLLKFLAFCWLGQMLKMIFFSLAGYYSIEWITILF